ncbi:MAG TPA: hypothetical protein VN681_09550 [Stellaceae bacterium]|nr:hypothetical protein [Stellaceae bacterium]
MSIAAGTAAAQSCGGEIDRLARQFDLPPEARQSGTTEAPAAPSTPPSGGAGATTTESRAQSSGVLSPPDAAAPTAIRPPRSAGDRPASPPDAATARGAGGELPAAERQRMAQLLQQAQAAARQGNEQQCLDRLRDAQTVPGVPGAK